MSSKVAAGKAEGAPEKTREDDGGLSLTTKLPSTVLYLMNMIGKPLKLYQPTGAGWHVVSHFKSNPYLHTMVWVLLMVKILKGMHK